MLSPKAVECLRKAAFIKGLKATTDSEAIEMLLGSLKNRLEVLDFALLRKAIFARQAEDPPLLPGGIAFPHARTDSVGDLVMAVGTCASPVAFAETPVRLIFLIGSPKCTVSEYLALLSFLARHLRGGQLIDRLVEVENMKDFVAAFGEVS
jgi:mannitol/fructose-specific phosphotransferase system IIA component (Ntr-type)